VRKLKGVKGEEGVVDGTQFVAGDDDYFAVEAGDQIADGVVFAEGNEQTAGALDQKIILNF
jgi:hypothetical protein